MSTTARLASFSLMLITFSVVAAVAAAADSVPAELDPAWVLEDEEGYLYLDAWPGGELVYASTMDGRIQAVDGGGRLHWSLKLDLSWPELACAPDGELWASDGLGLARADTNGKLVLSTSAFNGAAPDGALAAAAYVDIETGALYGIAAAGGRAWDGPRLAGDLRLVSLLPDAAGAFILEASDYTNSRQQFYGLGTDGAIVWSFDATAYGQMPIAGLYPVPRADGSLLLAPVTSSGDIGGQDGEYGSLLSLDRNGELEWEYPQHAYLLSFRPAANGAVDVVLPDYTIHRVGRDGTDSWQYAYPRDEILRDCLALPDGGALVCFSWNDGQLFSTDTVRAVRLTPDGAVNGEYLLSQPQDVYWYMAPLGEMLVCLDGDYRLVGFKLE